MRSLRRVLDDEERVYRGHAQVMDGRISYLHPEGYTVHPRPDEHERRMRQARAVLEAVEQGR